MNSIRHTTTRFFLILLGTSILLAGCHASRKTTVTPTSEVMTGTESSSVAPRTYTVMNFTGEVEGISVSGQLRLAEDSVLWLSVNKYIEVARGLATPDSLWLRAPLLGIDDATDYPALRQRLHRRISFSDLQTLVLAEDADKQLSQLASMLGYKASLRITRREQVPHLTFPFK